MNLTVEEENYSLRSSLAILISPIVGVMLFFMSGVLFSEPITQLNYDFLYKIFWGGFGISMLGSFISYPLMLIFGLPCIVFSEYFKLSKFKSFFLFIIIGYLGSFLFFNLPIKPGYYNTGPKGFFEYGYLVGSFVAFVSWLIMYVGREMPNKSSEHSERLL